MKAKYIKADDVVVTRDYFFKSEEIQAIVKSLPNGKSGGIDGVRYEDLKEMFSNNGHILVNIMNIMLVNFRFSRYWKECVIQRIPKKNFDENDLTMRDISLLPVCYKVLSKAICNRILPYIYDVVAFWQRAYLCKWDRQELIFTLKSAIDDFRHKSTKFYLIFIDFADAFGSVNHTFMFETLRVFNIPDIYNCLIEDLYKYSSFRVICGFELTERFFITRGTKTGDPFSALMFILFICKPMVVAAMVSLNLENEQRLNPLPVQAFADDIAMVAYNVSVINEMVRSSEPIMECAGLEVKPIKCAVYYARRSGNNWYTGKKDQVPNICIQGNQLPLYNRSTPYKYLGKSLELSGEDPLQISEFVDGYRKLVDQLNDCKLPLTFKCSTFNNLALAKILHHFYNCRIQESILNEMDDYLTNVVRKLFGMYASTTRLFIFMPRVNGGLGIKRISDVYYSTRVDF